MITNILEYCLLYAFVMYLIQEHVSTDSYFGGDIPDYCQSEESLGYLSYQDWGRGFEPSRS